MRREGLPALRERLQRIAREKLERVELKPTLYIDALVSLQSLTGETYRWLLSLEPFGPGNPTPVFLTQGLQVTEVRSTGEHGEHLRLKLRDTKGASWNAVAFRWGEQPVGQGSRVDAVYTLGTEQWGGERVLALRLLDIRPAG
jgi:single-stranded-DNA-specific exonuclease